MKTIAFFLEELSAKEMLDALLPRVLPLDIHHECKVFHGKHDLEKNLVYILKRWHRPGSVFLVMRDQDSGNCRVIKQKLLGLCREAGKADALVRVRIACHELERFYLGDLKAVEKGLDLPGLASQQATRKFRTPDALASPSLELRRLTNNRYQKLPGSRAIAPHLSLTDNKSQSFNNLLKGIQSLVGSVR